MLVYRLETADGHGPFHADSSINLLVSNHMEPADPGMLHSAGLSWKAWNAMMVAGSFRYAWISKGHVHQFKRSIDFTKHPGYRISTYEVEEQDTYTFSDGQVMFIYALAIKVDELILGESK